MVADLALRHDLIGSLIQIPTSADAWQKYRLSAEQLEFFEQNGYVAGIRILDDAPGRATAAGIAGSSRSGLRRQCPVSGISSQRIHRSGTGAVPCIGCMADQAGISRHIMGIPPSTVPASQLLGGAVRFWARSAVLQARSAWRRGRLAPRIIPTGHAPSR